MGIGGGLGIWRVESNQDSRWNKSGEAFGSVMAGGPQEMEDWIEECIKNFGEPPKDATKSFHKY